MKENKFEKEFSIAADGFHGHLYHPVKDDFPRKAVLVLGGGGVPYKSTQDMAEAFASQLNVTALAVGYFGVKDAPETIVRVPVEYVENAADRLHAAGYERVIAVGISKGAEFALAAAALLPQINGVIAFSPPSRVYMGVGKGISWANASSWSYHGKELPYAAAPSAGWKALRDSLGARELTFRPVYEKANQLAGQTGLIPVEKIQGPVLLVSSSADSLWPSAEACNEMITRLDANSFAWPHRALVYRYASHLLLPFDTAYGGLFQVGRQYPEECRKTIHELQAEVLAWIKLC